MAGHRIFWGDTHHNTYQNPDPKPTLAEVIAFARTYLDFYTGAYYTPARGHVPLRDPARAGTVAVEGGHPSEQSAAGQTWRGIGVEGDKPADLIEREWDEFCRVIDEANTPGEFVAFPGYEWQGDGTWGDHNVVYHKENAPVYMTPTLPELYAKLRQHDAIAIPHHTGYLPGIRAPRWEHCDEALSPFAELFSVHGCSETDEEWVGLRHNSHMGPGVGGGAYQNALDRGLHVGAICSTDNWTSFPAFYGQGIAACLATELTRDAIWEAFKARRVYGATGDRIELAFTVDDAPMGSIVDAKGARRIVARARGADAIDRIELLRDGRVIATHNHQGTWDVPPDGAPSRFKLRLEAGWGPRPGEIPFRERAWRGELSVSEGRVVGWQPCWLSRGQGVPEIDGATARFELVSRQEYVSRPFQGGVVFEVEADPSARATLSLNGLEISDTLGALAQGSRLLWYRDEVLAMLREATGVDPSTFERQDPVYYHYAHKAKLHRAAPEAAYVAALEHTDEAPLAKEVNYRVRVEQRNGQRAWSSPVWVRPG